ASGVGAVVGDQRGAVMRGRCRGRGAAQAEIGAAGVAVADGQGVVIRVAASGFGGAVRRGGGGRGGAGLVLASRHDSLHNTGGGNRTQGGRRRRVVGGGRAIGRAGGAGTHATKTEAARAPASVQPAGGP